MNFGYAIDRLKMGGKVRRSIWKGQDIWLEVCGSAPPEPFVYLTDGVGSLGPWRPVQSDMLAEDWSAI
jgi:hypothetical protein